MNATWRDGQALTGFPRDDDRWGFRDHVLVLPTHAAACPAAEFIAAQFSARTVAHDWTWPTGDPDTSRAAETLRGFADHPNVRATLLVGLTDDADLVAQAVIDDADRTVPLAAVTLADAGGSAAVVTAGVAALTDLLAATPTAERHEAPWSAMCLGLECGGSDALSGITANPALGVASDLLAADGAVTILAEITEIIGSEHLLAERAVSPEVAARVIEVVARFEADIARFGVDFRGSQPTPGNIDGGLTTIEEKSLGAARKGGNGPLVGVLGYAERPHTRGLHLMDTPGQDIEQMVGMVAAGANLVAFTSGRGTPTGSPIAPCLKIATNTPVFARLRDVFDLDAGTIVEGLDDLNGVGRQIVTTLTNTANGTLTAAERRGNSEFAISRIHQDATLASATSKVESRS